MDVLSAANECLKAARDSHERDYNDVILVLNQREIGLKERSRELNRKKHEIAQANGNLHQK